MNRNRKLANRGTAIIIPRLPKHIATKGRSHIVAKTKAGTCGGQRIKGGCTE